MLAQLCGQKANEMEMGATLFTKNSEGIAFCFERCNEAKLGSKARCEMTLTDFQLPLDSIFTSVSVIVLNRIILMHDIDEFTLQSRMLSKDQSNYSDVLKPKGTSNNEEEWMLDPPTYSHLAQIVGKYICIFNFLALCVHNIILTLYS